MESSDDVYFCPSEKLKSVFTDLVGKKHFVEDFKQDLAVYELKGILSFKVIQKIKELLEGSINTCYLHELLNGSEIYLPPLEIPPRNAELDIRVKKLKQEQEEKEYQRIVSNVSTSKSGTLNINAELKTLRAQLSVIVNFVLTVGGSFAFAYKAVEYNLEEPNIASQVTAGLVVALCVAVADLYFIIKGL